MEGGLSCIINWTSITPPSTCQDFTIPWCFERLDEYGEEIDVDVLHRRDRRRRRCWRLTAGINSLHMLVHFGQTLSQSVMPYLYQRQRSEGCHMMNWLFLLPLLLSVS